MLGGAAQSGRGSGRVVLNNLNNDDDCFLGIHRLLLMLADWLTGSLVRNCRTSSVAPTGREAEGCYTAMCAGTAW